MSSVIFSATLARVAEKMTDDIRLPGLALMAARDVRRALVRVSRARSVCTPRAHPPVISNHLSHIKLVVHLLSLACFSPKGASKMPRSTGHARMVINYSLGKIRTRTCLGLMLLGPAAAEWQPSGRPPRSCAAAAPTAVQQRETNTNNSKRTTSNKRCARKY